MAFLTPLAAPVASAPSALRCSARAVRVTAFRGARVASRAPLQVRNAPRMGFEISEGQEFDGNPLVLFLALAGWIVPSSLPAGIPLTEGTGLTQAFFSSMNANLANFPQGPSASDPFWTLCFLWHLGMFATMIFGTIGYNLRMNKKA